MSKPRKTQEDSAPRTGSPDEAPRQSVHAAPPPGRKVTFEKALESTLSRNKELFKRLAGTDDQHAAQGKSPAGAGVDELPNIGKPATRALLSAGIRTLADVAGRTEAELLALHGVGPKAIRLLSEAMAERGLKFSSTAR